MAFPISLSPVQKYNRCNRHDHNPSQSHQCLTEMCTVCMKNQHPLGWREGHIRREQTAPEAVVQAIGEGCQSGWGRLLSVTNAIDAGICRRADSGWA